MKKSKKPIVGAIILMVLGTFILLNNLGMLPASIPDYIFSWKVLLIVFGTITLFKRRWFGSFAMIGIGVYFLIPDIFAIPQSEIDKFWPLILIYLGVIMLFYYFFPPKNRFSRVRRRIEMHKKYKEYSDDFSKYKERKIPSSNTDYVDNMVILSGDSKKISSSNFQGGKLTSIMGGMELDLTNCSLSKEQNVIRIEIIMGGLTLTIPNEWNVIIEANSIMGGIFDESDSYIDPAAQLTIKGAVIMGGVEIKRKG